MDQHRNRRQVSPLSAIRPLTPGYPDPTEEKDGYHLENAADHRQTFECLFAAYVRELAADDPALLSADVSVFTEEIWQSPTDAPYLIRVGEEAAGLLVTSVPGEPIGEADCTSYLQELFVLPEYRRHGIGRDIFLTFIVQQREDTGFCMVERSPAGRYWARLLREAGYHYTLYPEDAVRVFCHVDRRGTKTPCQME